MTPKTDGSLWRRLFPFLSLPILSLLFLLCEPTGYALFLLAAVALHETGHLFAFLVCGEPLPRFSGQGIGLLLTPRAPLLSYPKEIFVCAAGPAFNLLAALALLPALQHGQAQDANFCFLVLHLLTALLNLLPIDGFDGGRILYALLAWLAGPRLAAFLSSAASLLCVLFLYFSGIFLFFLANSGPQLLLFSLLLLLAETKRRPGLFSS